MSISDGLDPYIFPSKDGKDAVYERRNGRRGVWCFIPARVGIFPFIENGIVLFPICTLIWRVNIYISRQAKGISRKNESTFVII